MTIHISAELSHICPLDDVATHARALEKHRFHRVWVPDTVVSPWEVWLTASVIMQTTHRLQIGLGVPNPYTRHPVVVAQMAATMQHLSQGRLTISLGKGNSRFLEKAGVQQHDKAVEECVTALRQLIAGERTTINGEVFQIDAMLLRTRPPDVSVPIFLAAIGPFRLANRYASWRRRCHGLERQASSNPSAVDGGPQLAHGRADSLCTNPY